VRQFATAGVQTPRDKSTCPAEPFRSASSAQFAFALNLRWAANGSMRWRPAPDHANVRASLSRAGLTRRAMYRVEHKSVRAWCEAAGNRRRPGIRPAPPPKEIRRRRPPACRPIHYGGRPSARCAKGCLTKLASAHVRPGHSRSGGSDSLIQRPCSRTALDPFRSFSGSAANGSFRPLRAIPGHARAMVGPARERTFVPDFGTCGRRLMSVRRAAPSPL
jgi:hypothetical protein